MGPCKVCLGSGTTGNPCEGCGAGLGERAAPVTSSETDEAAGNVITVTFPGGEALEVPADTEDLLPSPDASD